MKNRRGFLAALTAASGVAAGLPATVRAQTSDVPPSAPPQRPPPPAASSATAGHRPPTAAALAFAATCRTFDPALSDEELATIARNVDDARAAGAALNPKARPLRNSDEMVVRFAADERVGG